MDMQCPACNKEIPDDSTFCLSCGRPVKAEGVDMILPPEGSNAEGRATIFLIMAIAFLFFGGFLLIPAPFVGLGMFIPSAALIVLGVIMLSARYVVLRRYAKSVVELRKEASVRVRCSYCGTLNAESAEKCESCGAAL